MLKQISECIIARCSVYAQQIFVFVFAEYAPLIKLLNVNTSIFWSILFLFGLIQFHIIISAAKVDCKTSHFLQSMVGQASTRITQGMVLTRLAGLATKNLGYVFHFSFPFIFPSPLLYVLGFLYLCMVLQKEKNYIYAKLFYNTFVAVLSILESNSLNPACTFG